MLPIENSPFRALRCKMAIERTLFFPKSTWSLTEHTYNTTRYVHVYTKYVIMLACLEQIFLLACV